MNLQGIENIDKKSHEMAELLKVMAHPLRLQILCTLASGPKNVGEIEQELDLSQSLLSQYLKSLLNARLLENKREGKYIIYKIQDQRVLKLLSFLYENFCKN